MGSILEGQIAGLVWARRKPPFVKTVISIFQSEYWIFLFIFFFKFLDRAANIQQIAFFLLNKTDTLELPLLIHMLYYIDFHCSFIAPLYN